MKSFIVLLLFPLSLFAQSGRFGADTGSSGTGAFTISGGVATASGDVTAGFDFDGENVTGVDSIKGDLLFIPISDATASYKWLDADGGTPILNIDTINERVGIGTASPGAELHVGNGTVLTPTDFGTPFTAVIAEENFGGNSRETFVSWGKSTSNSSLSIINTTAILNAMAPAFYGDQADGTNGKIPLIFVGNTDTDSGTNPIIQFDTYQGGAISGGAIATRPLYNFSNGGTSVMRINATGNVGIGTTAPDSGTVQIAAGIGEHDFYVGDDVTWSYIDAGSGVTSSSDSTKKRNIVRVDSLIDAKDVAMKMLQTGVYRWQWNPDSIFVEFDSDNIAGWDTLDFAERDSVRQVYIVRENQRVQKISQKRHFGMLAQEFGSVFENDPQAKSIDWQKVQSIQWYTTQQLIREIVELKQRVTALENR